LSEREAAKESGKKKLSARTAVKAEENQIPFEPGRISGIRRKSGPPRTRQVVSMGVQSKMTEGREDDHLMMPAASGDVHG